MSRITLDRAEITSRQRLRAAAAADDYTTYVADQAERRAARVQRRMASLAVMLPRGCRIEASGTTRRPYKVRVWTPKEGDSIVWDPCHNTVIQPNLRYYKIDAAGVARLMGGLTADERDGVV